MLPVIKQTNLISESLVVFVCATTGQGDPPDNMKVIKQITNMQEHRRKEEELFNSAYVVNGSIIDVNKRVYLDLLKYRYICSKMKTHIFICLTFLTDLLSMSLFLQRTSGGFSSGNLYLLDL